MTKKTKTRMTRELARSKPKQTFEPRWQAEGYQIAAPPKTEKDLIDQLNQAKGFIGSVVKCIVKREHDTAYVLTDRAWDLLKQVRTAMEDLEP